MTAGAGHAAHGFFPFRAGWQQEWAAVPPPLQRDAVGMAWVGVAEMTMKHQR